MRGAIGFVGSFENTNFTCGEKKKEESLLVRLVHVSDSFTLRLPTLGHKIPGNLGLEAGDEEGVLTGYNVVKLSTFDIYSL